MTKLHISTPENFSFKSTLYSHGWSDLPPFNLIENPLQLDYTFCISDGKCVRVTISSAAKNRILIEYNNTISSAENHLIKNKIKHIFRLDEDYSEFYSLAKQSEAFSWIDDVGAGRMLRAANLWEDMVKMLCTTNCTWRLTQIMVENLVSKLGNVVTSTDELLVTKTFPDAKAVAACDEKYLRDEIKMGYRAPYLLEFASAVAQKEVDLHTFEDDTIPTAELYKRIRQIKGFGDYAVSNLLKLLGRYDYLGADSWSRKKFFEKHRNGKTCEDKKIHSYYKQYGKWSGLFFWMDVIEH